MILLTNLGFNKILINSLTNKRIENEILIEIVYIPQKQDKIIKICHLSNLMTLFNEIKLQFIVPDL